MTPEAIARLEEAAANCMKCGFCKAACPVFVDDETDTPRAKVRLARAVARGEIGLTDTIKRKMSLCLNCRACADECPSGVQPNRIAMEMREAYVDRDGLPLVKRLVFSGLKRPRLLALAIRMLGLGQQVSALDLQNNPLRALLPLMGLRRDKDLPVLGRRPLTSRLPEVMEPFGERKATVAYFPGCAATLIYPDMGLATVSVLRKLGARVILPRDLCCCGTPVFNSGDLRTARELAARNCGILSALDADFIVTSCGSCGLTLKREWQETLGLSEAGSISGKVLDIAEFVAGFAPDGAFESLSDCGAVTYHDSCHLRRGMGVHIEPRQILQAIIGGGFVEMDLADRCCGGGGTFCLTHPDVSQIVAETKMRCLAESGAGVVASGCPACVMQLRDSLVHRNMPQKALHTVELIDRSLRGGG